MACALMCWLLHTAPSWVCDVHQALLAMQPTFGVPGSIINCSEVDRGFVCWSLYISSGACDVGAASLAAWGGLPMGELLPESRSGLQQMLALQGLPVPELP